MIISRWIILKMRNVSDNVVDKLETHILYSITFLRKSFRVWDDVEKYFSARRTADVNITRRMCVRCWVTKAANAPRIGNNYCFSTSTMVAWRHFNFTLYVATLFNLHVHEFSDCQKEKKKIKFIKVHFRYFPRNNGYYFVSIKKFGGLLPWSQTVVKLLDFKQCLTDIDFLVCTEPNFRSCCFSLLFPFACRQYIYIYIYTHTHIHTHTHTHTHIYILPLFFPPVGPHIQVDQASSFPRLRDHIYWAHYSR